MTTTATPLRQPPANTMTLDAIHKGRRSAPDRILLYGVEGIGKSTWASEAPSPVFIAPDNGLKELDVSSWTPRTIGEVYGAIVTLETKPHPYKNLVLDSADWLEPLIWDDLCTRNGWANIETPEFQKGFFAAAGEWRKLTLALDRLIAKTGMGVIFIAHSQTRPFNNPAGKDYSRYECKLDKRASAILREWVDVMLFAVHEDFAEKAKGDSRVKATTTGRRIVRTVRSAAWDAKNRCNLPPVMALDFATYAAARAKGEIADPAALEAEARALLAQWAPDDATLSTVNDTLKQAIGNSSVLARIVDRLKTNITTKEGV